ncbi:MAG TPA: hypothetical protein PK637_18755 [Flavobacteriales bacterium]|nr:hypothetical protein [Flavobacteriales bacterium]
MQQFGNRYCDAKLSQMKMWLEDMAAKDEAKNYEVYVDDTKVVPRTKNIERFDDHCSYMDEDTKVVKVFVYNTENSHRYKQYIYHLKEEEKQKEKPLDGIEVEKSINERLSHERERWESQRLKDKIAELENKLQEAEDYIEKLTSLNEKLKAENDENKGKTGWLGLAEKALSNPVVMMKVGQLAGVLPKKEIDKPLDGTDEEEEPEVTITKKNRKPENESGQEEESEEETNDDDELEEISAEQFEVLKALQKADQKMKPGELNELGKLMNKLTDDPSLIIVVNDLIKNNTSEHVSEKNY